MLQFGEFKISRVVESEGPLFDAQTFLPDSTPEVIAANADWLVPRYMDPKSGQLILAIQSYILRTGRQTILVDTCVGNDKPRPARPMWDMMNGPYLADLAAAGVRPEEVDVVLCPPFTALAAVDKPA